MSFFRARFLRRGSRSTVEDARPADELRAQISALENELAESEHALADIESQAAAVEARAMDAIRSGDDRTARTALLAEQELTDKAAAIGADRRVLRAILEECHEFAGRWSDPARPGQ